MMKNKLMKRVVAVVSIAAMLTVAGCGAKVENVKENATDASVEAEAKSESDEKVVTVMVTTGLNPEQGAPNTYAADFRLYESIYEPLVKYGKNGVIEPALAERWEVSEDGKEYTFYLRQDVKFSDGTVFNSESVLANAERWDRASFSSPMTDIEKVDEYTVKITFEEKCYPCLTELTYPRPYRMASKNSYDSAGEFTEMIGTGQWMIESYVSEQEVVLVPNPYYYGEPSNIDKLILKQVSDGQSRVMALQSGQVDFSVGDIPAESASVIDAESTLDTFSCKGTMGFFLILNYENPILQDVNVRQAINYAVNKENIVDGLLNGKGTVAKGILAETNPYVTSENSKGYNYDVEKAAELLKEAGYEDTDEDGILEKNGEKLSLSLVFQTEEYASWKSICEYLQAELGKVGIEVELNLLETAAYYDAIWSNREYDMVIYRTYEDSWNPHGFLRSMFYAVEEGKSVCWYDGELNSDLDKVIHIMDETERQEKYDEIFTKLDQMAFTVPLYYPTRDYVYNTRLSNLVAAPTSYEAIEWQLLDKAE